ncbi:MAG: hypothetical protein ACSHWZ_19195 [Sulfitobacter sp.]
MDRSEEIALALGLTLERETANGKPWCPPKTAQKLKRYLTGYAKELDGLSQQAARLYYAMEVAHPHGALGFLYGKIYQLTADAFKHAFDSVDLSAVGTFDGNVLTLTEPHMRASITRPFELTVMQMPLIGAYIDATHNMLGFDAVQTIFNPLRTFEPDGAKQAANQLRGELDRWLRPGLQKEHYLKQARIIGTFLQAKDITRPDGIDDEAIISLWENEAERGHSTNGTKEGIVDGFKTYENTARLTLFYRQALQTAWNEHNARTNAISLSGADREDTNVVEIGVRDRQLDLASGADGDRLSFLEAADSEYEWMSPLITLMQEPGCQIKWTKTKKELGLLAQLLESHSQSREDFAGSKALFRGPPLPSFIRTIARYAVFGPFQNRWSDGFRNFAAPEAPSDGYSAFEVQLNELTDKLRETRLATAYVLSCCQRTQGAAMLSEIDAGETRSLLQEMGLRPGDASGVFEKFASHIEASENALAVQARKAYGAVNREGFRKQDLQNQYILEALEAGAPHLTPLIDILETLVSNMQSVKVKNDYQNDCIRFITNFQKLYDKNETTPSILER